MKAPETEELPPYQQLISLIDRAFRLARNSQEIQRISLEKHVPLFRQLSDKEFIDLVNKVLAHLENFAEQAQKSSIEIWPHQLSDFLWELILALEHQTYSTSEYSFEDIQNEKLRALLEPLREQLEHIRNLLLLSSFPAEDQDIDSFQRLLLLLGNPLKEKAFEGEKYIIDPSTGIELAREDFLPEWYFQLFTWALRLEYSNRVETALYHLARLPHLRDGEESGSTRFARLFTELALVAPSEFLPDTDLQSLEAFLKGGDIGGITQVLWEWLDTEFTPENMLYLSRVLRHIQQSISDQQVENFVKIIGLRDEAAGEVATLSHNDQETELFMMEIELLLPRIETLITLLESELHGYAFDIQDLMQDVKDPQKRKKRLDGIWNRPSEYWHIFLDMRTLHKKLGLSQKELNHEIEEIILQLDSVLRGMSYPRALDQSDPKFGTDLPESERFSQKELECISWLIERYSHTQIPVLLEAVGEILHHIRDQMLDGDNRLDEVASPSELLIEKLLQHSFLQAEDTR